MVPAPVVAGVRAVKPPPGVISPCQSLYPNAPIRTSSGWEVTAVLPESGVVLLPIAVWDLSSGETATKPAKEKNSAALLVGGEAPKLIVIVPAERAFVTCAEKMSVRAPSLPTTLDTSASLT